MKLGKFKINHYINYMVIGLLLIVLGSMTVAGIRFDNSLLFLLEKAGNFSKNDVNRSRYIPHRQGHPPLFDNFPILPIYSPC